jgi:hypothetical protein
LKLNDSSEAEPYKNIIKYFALRPATTSIQLAKSLNFAPDATGGVSSNKDCIINFVAIQLLVKSTETIVKPMEIIFSSNQFRKHYSQT